MSKSNLSRKVKKQSKKASRGGDSVSQSKHSHIQPVLAQPLQVRVYNGNFDKALRAFRALVQKERILSIYKSKQSYEKKSDKLRRKRNEAARKLMEVNFEKTNPSKSFKGKRNNSDSSQD
jgi:ribosomal protein S21